jgi:hypothetical protein
MNSLQEPVHDLLKLIAIPALRQAEDEPALPGWDDECFKVSQADDACFQRPNTMIIRVKRAYAWAWSVFEAVSSMRAAAMRASAAAFIKLVQTKKTGTREGRVPDQFRGVWAPRWG